MKKTNRMPFRNRLATMISTLREDIISGTYQAGDYLPSELTLIDTFDLSKNSVRKGLEQLVVEGLIEKSPRIGTRVLEQPHKKVIPLKFGYFASLVEEAQLVSLIEQFQQQHPHIDVQMIVLPYTNAHPNLKDLMIRESIDVVTVNNHNYELFLEHGAIPELLEPLAPKEGIYSFLNMPFTYNNTLYAQPFIYSPTILCYNKEHFKNAGVQEPDDSWTWEILREAAIRLSQENRIGLHFHLLSPNRWPLFLLQNDVSFQSNSNGGYDFEEEKLREALQTIRGLFSDSGLLMPHLSESDTDSEQLFLDGKVSMIVTSYFKLNQLQQTDFQYDIAPLPYMNEARTLFMTIGLAINQQSANKQAASQLLDYLLSHSSQLAIRKDTLSIPSLQAAAEWTSEPSLHRPSRFFMYRDILPTFRAYSELNIPYRDLRKIMIMLRYYWAELEDLDTVCRKLREG